MTISTGKINLNDFDRSVVLNMTEELCIVKTVIMPSVHKLLSVLREKLNGSGMPPRYLEFSEEWGSSGRLFKDEGRYQKFFSLMNHG